MTEHSNGEWMLVPREPTPEMIDAWIDAMSKGGSMDIMYSAMLAAAPTPPSTDRIAAEQRGAASSQPDEPVDQYGRAIRIPGVNIPCEPEAAAEIASLRSQLEDAENILWKISGRSSTDRLCRENGFPTGPSQILARTWLEKYSSRIGPGALQSTDGKEVGG